MKVGIIGGSGFIGKYIIHELLNNGHNIKNIDLVKYDIRNNNYKMIQEDAKNSWLERYLYDRDIIINLAAKLGGIAYFHKYPATLLVENEKIQTSVFETCVRVMKKNKTFKKIIQFSSSMVYENTNTYPSKEGDEKKISPPSSVYGFQKLATEYYCQAFNEEYNLPYVIVRPFNVIGIGENPLLDSHVIPQLIYKTLKKQYPLEIFGDGKQIRVFTHGKDVASAIKLIVENNSIINTDFNISNEENKITILELAEKIWKRINPEIFFKYISILSFKYDVQKRVCISEKAKNILGWTPKITIDESLDEIIEDIKKWVK